MTRTHFLALALAAAACGSVEERNDCATSASCPLGQYCAHTSDGSVCWPDGVAPTVTGVAVACGADGCLGTGPVVVARTGQLLVSAEVADDQEVFAVFASVDVDPAHTFPLAHQAGSTWSGTIPLAQLEFPALAREVVVTVRALDGAKNPASAEPAQPPTVTRVKWAKPLDTSIVTPTAPAIAADGTVVVGGSDGKLRFFLQSGHPARLSLAVAGGAIAQAPSIGAQAIWVGANDGKLYAVKLDGSGELTARTCTASGVAKGPPAILTTAGADVAFGAFSGGRISASTATSCAQTPLRDAFSGGAAIEPGGRVLGATMNAGTSSLRGFSWDGAAFEELWSQTVGSTVVATPAIDADGRTLTGGQDAGLDRTTTAGVTSSLATLAGSVDASPIVLSNGDIVVGDASGKLHRLASDGTAVWGTPADLGAAVHAPLALTKKDGAARFLVATEDGKVHALDDAGAVLWSGALTGGLALGAGNLFTPAGAALAPDGSPFSTAYFAGADGNLYAVIVEGTLDTTAPWPKAWHDARNTSRAGGAF